MQVFIEKMGCIKMKVFIEKMGCIKMCKIYQNQVILRREGQNRGTKRENI